MEVNKPLQMIDKDKAVEALRSRAERIKNAKIVRWTLMAVAKFIDDIPTIDAVEVVRCKDCIHRKEYECDKLTLGNVKCGTTDNWFCAYGEKHE